MQCEKCGKVFRWDSELQRHRNRKTSCANDHVEVKKEDQCPHCAKHFASYSSMRRHARLYCGEGHKPEETKAEETQKETEQDERKEAERQQDVIELRAKVQELSAAVQELSALSTSLQQTETPPNRTKKTTTKTRAKARILEIELEREEEQVEIIPWDDKEPIRITTEQIRDAFNENPVLQEYASLRNPEEMTDPKKAPPYVLEMMMDLIKRGHEAPEARNVHLNPARADQVRVKAKDDWEVRELGTTARLLLGAVSKAMKKSTLSDEEQRKLERDVQEALAWSWQLYEEAPAEYAQRARKPLAAHLENMTLMRKPQLDRIEEVKPRE